MSGARVKPLEWVKHSQADIWRADTFLGTYKVFGVGEKPTWDFDGLSDNRLSRPAKSVESAKSFAQADYDARILSAIDTTALDAERDELRALVEELRANRQEIAAEVKQLACLVQETLRLSEEERRLREAKQAEAAAEIARLTEERDRLQDANMWRPINTAPETGEFLVGVWVGSRWSHWVASGGEDLGNDGEFGDPPTHWRPSQPLAEPPPR